MRRLSAVVLLSAVFIAVLYAASFTGDGNRTLMNDILARYKNTGATNAVAAVYLDFRVLDTLLEAFLLLVSVMGISQFLRLEDVEMIHFDDEGISIPASPVVSGAIKLILPVLFLYSLYIITFGAFSPGGGFQGGAILSTAVIYNYLSKHSIKIKYGRLVRFEELLFISFITLAGVYFLLYDYVAAPYIRTGYMILCGFIIGIKVAIGLAVIFIRFTGENEHRTRGGGYE